MKNYNFINFFKNIVFVVSVTAMLIVTSSCGGTSFSYLTDEQNAMLNSIRTVSGTDNMVFEVNYTADYKVNDFLKSITENLTYSASGCRVTMKKLLADGSNIIPDRRLSNKAPGCSSVICKNSDGIPVIGRNYDLDIRSGGAVIVIHTSPCDGYKSVGVADGAQFGLSFNDLNNNTANKELMLYAPYYTMDGVNEKGFACSVMLLNEGACVQFTQKNWLPSTLVVRYLLDNADSVDKAIELLKNMDLRNDYFIEPLLADVSFHWAITDNSGKKAVIEYVDGNMVVNEYPLKVKYNETDGTMQTEYPKEEKGYLISTNFYVSEGVKNTKCDSGKWRYETLEKLMSENPAPTKEQLRDIMKSAKYYMNDKEYIYTMEKEGLDPKKPENWDWITIWTDILNTSDKTLSFWSRENYDTENVFAIEY